MGSVKKFLYNLFLKKYDEFARLLGYEDWNTALENTFFVFSIDVDGGWYATQLPNKEWAVWTDYGELPYAIKEFHTWQDAIRYLRKLFEEANLPDTYWNPEGYDEGEDVLSKEPDREKMD